MCQCMEGACDVGEVLDEAMVEVDETKEQLHFLHLLGHQPVSDALHLYRVHGHLVLGDNESQVFNFLTFEFTLFCL